MKKLKIVQILENTTPCWDNDRMRPSVRHAFKKALKCRTGALGALLFASETETRLVPCTCKSPACPSCGQRARVQWLREQLAGLPDIPYKGITLTMPDVLWPFFRRNRRLLDYLPVLGAKVLSTWAKEKYGAQLLTMVVPHTFSRYVTFNPHLHVLVSVFGLRSSDSRLVPLTFNRDRLMRRWRRAVIMLLLKAVEEGILVHEGETKDVELLLREQSELWWSVNIAHCKGKRHFLNYIARYARHPAIAEHRIMDVNDRWVVFWADDHRLKRRTETWRAPSRFVELLAEHIPDRYQHSIRHFELLSPRGKNRSNALIFELLGQQRRTRPKRISWTQARKEFSSLDALVDSNGQPMHRKGWVSPCALQNMSGFCDGVRKGKDAVAGHPSSGEDFP